MCQKASDNYQKQKSFNRSIKLNFFNQIVNRSIFLHKFHDFYDSKYFNHSVKSWKSEKASHFVKLLCLSIIIVVRNKILERDAGKNIEPKPKLYVIHKYFLWTNNLNSILIFIR